MYTINIHKYNQVFKDFFSFVQSPRISIKSAGSIQEKITETTLLFILKFVFSISVAFLIGMFYEPQNLTDKSMSERFTPFIFLLTGGLILPVFEEILFRLSLVFKPLYLALSFACLSYYLSTKLIFNTRLSIIDDTFFQRIGISILLGFVLFLILKNPRLKVHLASVWSSQFKIIYYISALIFAWLHLFNFELNYINLLLTPILTLPQLFSGLISGYIRIKFGFIYPLIFHVLTNSILISLSILFE